MKRISLIVIVLISFPLLADSYYGNQQTKAVLNATRGVLARNRTIHSSVFRYDGVTALSTEGIRGQLMHNGDEPDSCDHIVTDDPKQIENLIEDNFAYAQADALKNMLDQVKIWQVAARTAKVGLPYACEHRILRFYTSDGYLLGIEVPAPAHDNQGLTGAEDR